jgi:V/A-type H+-transporting ATPase subunit I
MRLFALGLASASMAMTFNQLAVSTREAMPGLGLLFALLILVFGHAINLALCIMGGVVHGLRLNVIEFFKWGLAEEGRPFHAYAKKETEQ